MPTFQIILYAVLQAISTLLPFSPNAAKDFLKAFLEWGAPSAELQYWVTLLLVGVLLFFFRFDWLGIISALLKTIVRPKSLNATEKTLDQQIVLFLLLASIPGIILRAAVQNHWIEFPDDLLTQPILMILAAFLSFVFLQLGLKLNRRLRGLNHLRLTDAVTVGAFLLLAAHPGFSILLLSFSAFAICHYHSEAIFKYSLLILTLFLISQLCTLGTDLNLGDTLRHIGTMNVIVVTVLTLTFSWVTLENTSKNFTLRSYENSFRFFRWVQLIILIGYAVVWYLQRVHG